MRKALRDSRSGHRLLSVFNGDLTGHRSGVTAAAAEISAHRRRSE